MKLLDKITEYDDAFLSWILYKMPESFERMNDAGIEVINAFKAKFSNAIGYKFNEGIVVLGSMEKPCNFCCNYIFTGTPENISCIKTLHDKYTENTTKKNLDKLISALNDIGFYIQWS